MEQVWIDGIQYDVDVDSMEISSLNGNCTYVYCTFHAWDTLFDEPVILQYVSINRSIPDPTKPYKIIRPERDEK